MTQKIPIVFSTDNNYIMPTGVAIFSLLESAKPTTTYQIYVLINDDVTEESKKLLRKQVSYYSRNSIEFINVGKVFENSLVIRNISIATYSRLLIPWLLPQYDKVIYADVDMIIKIDLSDIYNINFKDNLFAGVIDYTYRFNRKFVKYYNKIGLDVAEYINAGFLVINSKIQRELNLMEVFLKEAKKKYLFQDQDIINIVAKKKITYVSPNYNLTVGLIKLLSSEKYRSQEFYERQKHLLQELDSSNAINSFIKGKNCIIHYTGRKPWNTFTQAWREWWNAYQRSIFYEPERELIISKSILCLIPTWRSIAGQIKRKLFKPFSK